MPLNKVAITGCIVPLTKKEVLMNISERPETSETGTNPQYGRIRVTWVWVL
jgi:hypothetical protein